MRFAFAGLSAAASWLGLLTAFPAGLPFQATDYSTDDRLQVELWVQEPQVVDPVAIAWDADGVAYVAECRDYPYGVGPDGKVGSTVRRLEDTDGNGVPDRVTVFAKDLSFVTSVTPWRAGILAVAPPNIWYLTDTNHDGIADVREVVLSGLVRGISDSLASGLRYGLDNQIHVANGGSSGAVSSPRLPERVTRLGENDFAFQPDTGVVQLTAPTGGGFGLAFDAFGRAFTPYNISHIQHRFLPLQTANRYPGLPPTRLTASISDHEEMSRIYPISIAQTRPNHPEQAGHFSAAGGMGFLDSPRFPVDLNQSVLVGDVVGNLVHRDVIHPDGPVWRASRAPSEVTREFLASRDPAFRPVAFEIGPDGALYIADMQREVIEHPDYIPEKLRRTLDLRSGETRGRILRLTPKGSPALPVPKLAKLKDTELVPWLSSSNSWARGTAQRLLVERHATAVGPQLRQASISAPNASGRVHALWTLSGLGELKEQDVIAGLQDTDAAVRENALRLAETAFPGSASLRNAVIARAADDSPRVRFIAAQALGTWSGAEVTTALEQIFARDADFSWSRYAVLASVPPSATRELLNALLQRAEFKAARDAPKLTALTELADWLAARATANPENLSWLLVHLTQLKNPEARLAALSGVVSGLERAGEKPSLTPEAKTALDRWIDSAATQEMNALWKFTRGLGLPENATQRAALDRAVVAAQNATLPLEQRVAATQLLAFGSAAVVTDPLGRLLYAREPIELQKAALAALDPFRDPSTGTLLVSHWRAVSPNLRPLILETLLERRAFHDALLTALENGQIQVGELNLDLEQRRRLLRGGSPEIRQRAARFMGDEEYSNRKTLVTDWLARLPATGDPQRGKAIFLDQCAKCHASGPLGHRVGPDLTGVAHRSVEDLLSNILDPNMAINPGFVASIVETRDGEAQTGLVRAETAEAITLLQAEGKQLVIPRRDILRIESSAQSLMPEGLEAGKTPQQVRDLIAFLQSPP